MIGEGRREFQRIGKERRGETRKLEDRKEEKTGKCRRKESIKNAE